MSNSLDLLKQTGTVVVSDSGDFESIDAYKPQDATTNPSLILAATKQPNYAKLIDVAIDYAKSQQGDLNLKVEHALDRLLVEFGRKILDIIPGRVSTEVDASLSFNKEATKEKAREIIQLYKENGVHKDRVLIKIASTWEGIQAAKDLEAEGIHCNLTLLFGFGQAVACAEAGVTLISPFVGRILDWYKKNKPEGSYDGEKDPGVVSVQKIYNYYKQHGYNTIVMGASFRTTDEIKNLAGCDFLTVAPALLEQLKNSTDKIERKLDPQTAQASEKIEKTSFINDEAKFRWALFEEQMAFDKLHEGIRKFGEDAITLRGELKKRLE
ncbi:transaldolase [Wallemia mellicola CBS 633.66]|nr:transaldolase [Wallemia mellicola CBS 633.66]TIB70501.1 hypothetical protein E3Q24_02918 [Wallemia mellicola]EIM19610.1 transaldolase [Wallemia mellicola CBS 633.66]TIB73935.1 hypothetical protein E3Q23_02847 [Wallemia mellicola]TIB83195.1 transaldolase [Wallemia mellicola]TIB85976.1 transaldolase [Wallemia mellicola]|eukprot:XP_006960407.1 transaldolase [Wallemia mellicola CBS 633.66]